MPKETDNFKIYEPKLGSEEKKEKTIDTLVEDYVAKLLIFARDKEDEQELSHVPPQLMQEAQNINYKDQNTKTAIHSALKEMAKYVIENYSPDIARQPRFLEMVESLRKAYINNMQMEGKSRIE